jgi:hypothetical protein
MPVWSILVDQENKAKIVQFFKKRFADFSVHIWDTLRLLGNVKFKVELLSRVFKGLLVETVLHHEVDDLFNLPICLG